MRIEKLNAGIFDEEEDIRTMEERYQEVCWDVHLMPEYSEFYSNKCRRYKEDSRIW